MKADGCDRDLSVKVFEKAGSEKGSAGQIRTSAPAEWGS